MKLLHETVYLQVRQTEDSLASAIAVHAQQEAELARVRREEGDRSRVRLHELQASRRRSRRHLY